MRSCRPRCPSRSGLPARRAPQQLWLRHGATPARPFPQPRRCTACHAASGMKSGHGSLAEVWRTSNLRNQGAIGSAIWRSQQTRCQLMDTCGVASALHWRARQSPRHSCRRPAISNCSGSVWSTTAA
eukprot:6138227-Pyramimonas_sp.AAC.1